MTALERRIRTLIRQNYSSGDTHKMLSRVRKALLSESFKESRQAEFIDMQRTIEKEFFAAGTKEKSGGAAELEAANKILQEIAEKILGGMI